MRGKCYRKYTLSCVDLYRISLRLFFFAWLEASSKVVVCTCFGSITETCSSKPQFDREAQRHQLSRAVPDEGAERTSLQQEGGRVLRGAGNVRHQSAGAQAGLQHA